VRTAAAALASRLTPWAPAVLWAAAIFFFSGQSHPPQPPGAGEIPFIDKLEHLAAYGVLGALVFLALRRAAPEARARPRERDAALAVVIAAVYGVSDEVHQAFVPFRQADAADLAVDALGALLVVAAVLVWSKRRVPRDESRGKG